MNLEKYLTFDADRKQIDQLKQAMKTLKRVDYSQVGLQEKTNFEKVFVQRLSDIYADMEFRRGTNQIVDKEQICDEIIEMIYKHVDDMKRLETIKSDFSDAEMFIEQCKPITQQTQEF
jgi:hypothetical protein